MTRHVSTNRCKRRPSQAPPKTRSVPNLQRPSGVIGHRVKRVGGDKFAIVCIDPAQQRSEWMMADYFGNLLIEQQTLPHQAVFFQQAVAQVRAAQQEHEIQDTIVVVERTGNYHLAPQRAFAQAGFETRVVHPFTTRHFRLPANPGIKTVLTIMLSTGGCRGFGLRTRDSNHPIGISAVRLDISGTWWRTPHRRRQVREHHLSMPVTHLFDHLLDHRSAMPLRR
jgi:ribosomal protein S11